MLNIHGALRDSFPARYGVFHCHRNVTKRSSACNTDWKGFECTRKTTMHSKLQKIAVSTIGVAALTTINTSAQSADAIIDKLVDKGILTVDEANELREEADKGFNSAYQVKSGLPDWVTSLRIGGDFRGRYENFSSDEPSFIDRHRFRYRVRPGIVATLRDNFEVGFRLTSSEAQGTFGGDPISGNSTFQDNASKKFAYIDLAYAKWTAVNNADWSLNLTVGKM